jgi:hypothetical protein
MMTLDVSNVQYPTRLGVRSMPVSRHLYLIEPLLLSLHNNILHVVGFNKSSLYVYKLQCRPNHGVELAKGGQARKKKEFLRASSSQL